MKSNGETIHFTLLKSHQRSWGWYQQKTGELCIKDFSFYTPLEYPSEGNRSE